MAICPYQVQSKHPLKVIVGQDVRVIKGGFSDYIGRFGGNPCLHKPNGLSRDGTQRILRRLGPKLQEKRKNVLAVRISLNRRTSTRIKILQQIGAYLVERRDVPVMNEKCSPVPKRVCVESLWLPYSRPADMGHDHA